MFSQVIEKLIQYLDSSYAIQERLFKIIKLCTHNTLIIMTIALVNNASRYSLLLFKKKTTIFINKGVPPTSEIMMLYHCNIRQHLKRVIVQVLSR